MLIVYHRSEDKDLTMDLFQRSVQTILTYQAGSGAYPACPSFPTYRYSWFRDGAFIAYAMDLAGQHKSAHLFYDWAAHTILRHAAKVERAIEKARYSDPLGEDHLHTRYTLAGRESANGWPNFQLDGLGTWLWALAEHVHQLFGFTQGRPPTLPGHWWQAVDLTARYLAALWFRPCYDLWEEYPQYLHPYTLAAIYAGLRAAERLMVVADRRPPTADGEPVTQIADRVRNVVLERGVQNGHLVKHISPQGEIATVGRLGPAVVDASLIGVATPYHLLSPGDPIMQATVARIEADLHCDGGGVHRYLADTYYGGGEWVLLAAWLGWHHAGIGETAQAKELLHWVEIQADADGHLPEQVSTHLLAPGRYTEWETRWGPVAKPLLWSHAMHLILHFSTIR